MFSVYGLFDPRTGALRYVGYTSVSLKERLKSHMSCRKKSRKRSWIASLRLAGTRPEIATLEVFDSRGSALEAESEWISMMRAVGASLTNISPGGESPEITEETKRRMSEAKVGVSPSPSHRANLSRSLMGHGVSAEARAKMRAAKLGTKWSAKRREAAVAGRGNNT